MSADTLKIDQGKLFAACDHDKRTMAMVLALVELTTGERVPIRFAHSLTDRDVDYYRSLFIEALGLPTNHG